MYRIKSTGEIKSQGDLRKMFPNVSLPRVWDEGVLNYLGVDPVFESPTPTTTRYQTAFKDGVEFKNDKWMWKWVVSEMDDEAKASLDATQAKSVREQRNNLVAESDWTQLDDTPITNAKKLEWAAYRQALRDIPTQAGFPWDVTWPEAP
jgi:hypothetical protein